MKNWTDVSEGISRLNQIQQEKERLVSSLAREKGDTVSRLAKERDEEINSTKARYAQLISREQEKVSKRFEGVREALSEEANLLEASINDYVIQSDETEKIRKEIEQPFRRETSSSFEFKKTFNEGSVTYRNELPLTVPRSYSRREKIEINLNSSK